MQGGLIGSSCWPCDSGIWCTNGATSSSAGTPAPPGYYFNPSQLPLQLRACPAGMYGNVTGAGSLEEGCFDCWEGQWCLSGATGLFPSSLRGTCPAGHYCPLGTAYSNQVRQIIVIAVACCHGG